MSKCLTPPVNQCYLDTSTVLVIVLISSFLYSVFSVFPLCRSVNRNCEVWEANTLLSAPQPNKWKQILQFHSLKFYILLCCIKYTNI